MMSLKLSSVFLFVVVSSVSAAVLSERAITLPPVNGQFDYQIGGSYTPDSGVTIVTRDHAERPVAGIYSICYINAFQTQPDDNSFSEDLILHKANGDLFEDPDWEGEYFLDTSTAAKRTAIAAVLQRWIDGCKSAGYQGLEPDNLDTFTRSNKLLTKANNLALAKLIVDYAHSVGLAVAQKNTGSELGSDGKTTAGFDFAVAEECQVYSECNSYTDVYGNNVIEIEYTDNGTKYFTSACSTRGSNISIILRDRDVVPKSSSKYKYQAC